MSDILDKETKLFLLVLAGIVVFMLFIFPKLNSQLFTYDITQKNNINSLFKNTTNASASVTIDEKKNYSATISTTKGDFEIDLLEHNAPINVSNFVNQANANKYEGAEIITKRDFLLHVNVEKSKESSKTVVDEINADNLGLNEKKVRDTGFLKDLYDPEDKSTDAFSSDNLTKYEDYTLKQFYTEILGYKYNSKVFTPPARKYMVYMTNKGPDTNKTDFFILMTDSAEHVDGMYTPIGQVIGGHDTLDKLNEADISEDLKINKITVNTKQ